MTEWAIDQLLREYQRACENVVVEGDSNISRTTKARAIVRNELRAKLIEGEQWRTDFIATEQTARKLDEQWERLRVIVGAEHDEIDDDDFAWSELVDQVEARIRNSNRIVALLVALKHDREITRFPAYAEEIRCVLAALVIQPARLRAIEAAHLAEARR